LEFNADGLVAAGAYQIGAVLFASLAIVVFVFLTDGVSRPISVVFAFLFLHAVHALMYHVVYTILTHDALKP